MGWRIIRRCLKCSESETENSVGYPFVVRSREATEGDICEAPAHCTKEWSGNELTEGKAQRCSERSDFVQHRD
jgi:hypothetical protein